MKESLRQRLLAVFRVEHQEHLGRIRAVLAELPPNASGALLDEPFRRAHSLKGAARAVDLRELETLAHRLESLFSRVREGTLRLDDPVVRVIHQALDATEDCVAAPAGETPESVAPALAAIDGVLRGEGRGTGDEEGSAQGLALSAQAPIEEGSVPGDEGVGGETTADKDTSVVSASGVAVPGEAPTRAAEPDTVRVGTESLDRLMRTAGDLLTEGMRQELLTKELTGLSGQVEALRDEWERVRQSGAAELRRLDAQPELSRIARFLDGLDSRLRELESRSRAAQHAQQRAAWGLRTLGGRLQEDVRRTRMVPAETVFGGFGRMVRDLARDAGKEIDFRARGLETHADRMVLQSLKDPLMHVLRNAIGHGIEPPEERARRGKPRVGRIVLDVEAAGGRLSVSVTDDGRGLDLERIRRKARAQGLSADDRESLLRLVFQPGFSTAGGVTDLSGRGMGLSVVAEAAQALQGNAEARPGPEGGTTIAVRVPLSLTTQRLLLVRCGGQTFAVPSHSLERLHRAPIKELHRVEGQQVLSLQGRPVPVFSLAEVLEMESSEVAVEGDTLPVMLLRWGERRVGLVVDAFLFHTEGLVQHLPPALSGGGRVTGGILMGDGSVVLVLHPPDLLEVCRRTASSSLLRTVAPAEAARVPTILVVDDSITTRTLEKSILEAHGYRVRVAVDGVEALHLLAAEPADLVITDVEMPRLDGFGLLQAMKSDQRLAGTPVIVVTSLEKREHRERGLALGADAYVVKRRFEQAELLETVRQLL